MIVIKLGGSVIQKDLLGINPQIFAFLDIVRKSESKVLIVNGGGPFCRLLQNSLKDNGITDAESLGTIGYKVNNVFGEFLKLNLPKDVTYPEVINSIKILNEAKSKIQVYKYFIGGAWEIGHSSDYDAVFFALEFGVNQVIRISNIDYVYDKDPNKYPDALKFERLSWGEYFKIIGDRNFVDGGNYPFDPIASKLASENKVTVYLTSIDNILMRKSLHTNNFNGTVIQ